MPSPAVDMFEGLCQHTRASACFHQPLCHGRGSLEMVHPALPLLFAPGKKAAKLKKEDPKTELLTDLKILELIDSLPVPRGLQHQLHQYLCQGQLLSLHHHRHHQVHHPLRHQFHRIKEDQLHQQYIPLDSIIISLIQKNNEIPILIVGIFECHKLKFRLLCFEKKYFLLFKS